MPYGEAFTEERVTGAWESPYKFNGKEIDQETGLYYYGARYYDPQHPTWHGVDPLAEKYPEYGGYVYCAANPVKYVDPDGRDWVESESGTIAWNDRVTSQETAGKGETWLGKNVLVGTHNRDESLNEPINSARFDLYLESNKEGSTATIYGNTIPADTEKYGTLAEGLYDAEFGQRAKYVKRGEPDPGLLINKGKSVPTAPGSPKKTMTEIFFHKGNNNRENLADSRGNPYSAGCQTGGSYKGSHKAYSEFAENLIGFKGSYYLRGTPKPTQSQNTLPRLSLPTLSLPNDNTRVQAPMSNRIF